VHDTTRIRLAAGKSAKVTLALECVWSSSLPATLSAELLLQHHSGAAPEVDDAKTPPRTGLTRASARVGDGGDGALEIVVVPDNSSGAGVTKNFAVKVYAADGGSGTAPATSACVVVASAEGTFVSLT
jgi:hypothetical protein